MKSIIQSCCGLKALLCCDFILFKLYMHSLSKQLGKCKTGCLIGNTLLNHLIPAPQLLGSRSCMKYLGHLITDRMEDDADMYRNRRMLYVQANMLVRKFHHCSDDVKVSLFRAYCTPLYAAPSWVNYKKETMRKLQVAYNA